MGHEQIGVIVAVIPSKWGGNCKDCKSYIPKGGITSKISEQGPTTKNGQGPGRWVCIRCAGSYEGAK